MSRVLIADDSPEQVEMWKLLLERTGHEVATATSRNEAISKLEQFAPRVLVLDLNLPTAADGKAVLLQSRLSHPDTRIVLVSGWPEGIDESSVDELLAKPVLVQEMLATIAKLD
jgi:CheY-like chemotaxis protein